MRKALPLVIGVAALLLAAPSVASAGGFAFRLAPSIAFMSMGDVNAGVVDPLNTLLQENRQELESGGWTVKPAKIGKLGTGTGVAGEVRYWLGESLGFGLIGETLGAGSTAKLEFSYGALKGTLTRNVNVNALGALAGVAYRLGFGGLDLAFLGGAGPWIGSVTFGSGFSMGGTPDESSGSYGGVGVAIRSAAEATYRLSDRLKVGAALGFRLANIGELRDEHGVRLVYTDEQGQQKNVSANFSGTFLNLVTGLSF